MWLPTAVEPEPPAVSRRDFARAGALRRQRSRTADEAAWLAEHDAAVAARRFWTSLRCRVRVEYSSLADERLAVETRAELKPADADAVISRLAAGAHPHRWWFTTTQPPPAPPEGVRLVVQPRQFRQ